MTDDAAAKLDLIEDWETETVDPQTWGQWYVTGESVILSAVGGERIESDTVMDVRR